MAITHYIDSTASEIARARIKSLTNRVPEAFPVLVYGDTRPHNFVFWNGQTATVESYSGNASYSLRVTLGQVQEGPKEGTYDVTCGSTESVPALGDAETLQDALNLLTTITSEGGVTVSGTFPNFLVTWNTVGVKTAFTVDSALLIPQTSISLVTMQTGSASVCNQVAVILRQAAISSQTSWTTISSPANGWTGTITTNTSGALQLLNTQGQQVGNVLEVSTLLTAEVLDASNIPVSYYQTPVILRAKNLDPNGTVSPGTPTYTLGDILYGNSLGGLSKLPGSTSVTLKVLSMTGDGTNAAAPAWVDPDTQGVASITGTANQITASASTGAVTLSLDGPHDFTSLTSTALLLGSGTSPISASNLTYSTPTLSVPDAFNVSSAGSISLTAGGSNNGLTLTHTGTGAVNIASNSGTQFAVTSTGSNDAFVYIDAAAGRNRRLVFRTLGSIRWGVFANNSSEAGSNAGSNFTINAYNDSGTFVDTPLTITRAVGGAAQFIRPLFVGATTSNSAWGVNGQALRSIAATYTDTSSSGTVASAVGNSFGIPTFAASSSTTFTNAANLYIAGDVATGTNVTLTNSYGLWNVGKTRLDGNVLFAGAVIATPQALSGAGAVNVTTTCTDFTSTGAAQALTLANGTAGQIKTITHVVDGGSGVLTPTTKIGFTTITFTNVGDAVTLRYTAQGWSIIGIFGAVAA